MKSEALNNGDFLSNTEEQPNLDALQSRFDAEVVCIG